MDLVYNSVVERYTTKTVRVEHVKIYDALNDLEGVVSGPKER